MAHVAASETARTIGTELHAAIEATLRVRGSIPVLSPAATWRSAHGSCSPATWSSSASAIDPVVYSHTHHDAGTPDLLATLDATGLLHVLQRQGRGACPDDLAGHAADGHRRDRLEEQQGGLPRGAAPVGGVSVRA
jgi:hypothetical protein